MEKKFFKRVENTVGKGEIARYEQFLLFPQRFQKTSTTDTYKPGLVLKRVKQTRTVLYKLKAIADKNFTEAQTVMFFFAWDYVLRAFA